MTVERSERFITIGLEAFGVEIDDAVRAEVRKRALHMQVATDGVEFEMRADAERLLNELVEEGLVELTPEGPRPRVFE
jgi:hypothetical protein